MSKKPPILLAVLAVAAAPILATPQASTAAAAPAGTPWQTVAASGPVQSRAAAEPAWRDVARGDELWPSTHVQTGRKGRATLTRSASLVILDPQSRLELPGDDLGGPETSVVQTEGRVLYKVDSRAHPHFEVVTPFLVAGVKGTSFLVTVTDRYTAVTVEHGLVEITNPATGQVLDLGPGETVVRERHDVEMELVRGEERSRVARLETRHLERMDAASEGDVAADETTSRAQALLEDAIGDLLGTSAGPAQEGGQGAGPNTTAVADLADEVVEEVIRDGILDGDLLPPIDLPLPLPVLP